MRFRTIKENVEEYNTKGAYNSFGYINNAIRYDDATVIAKSDNLIESIDWEVDKDKLGGIIVLSTDVNAVELSTNRVINWVKQKFETIKNRIGYKKKIDKFSKNYDDIYAWTIGKYLHGRYKANNGKIFDENSISVELINVDEDTIISFAEDLCEEFKQESVLVKLYGENRILFVRPNH